MAVAAAAKMTIGYVNPFKISNLRIPNANAGKPKISKGAAQSFAPAKKVIAAALKLTKPVISKYL